MKQLSNHRRMNAVNVGTTYGLGHLRQYAENPGCLPRGINSIADIAAGIARVSLFMHCSWKPSEEEKDLAAQTARDCVELAVKFAKVFKSQQ